MLMIGWKRWHMLPPQSGYALFNRCGVQILDLRDVDAQEFPHFHAEAAERMIEFVQKPGEIVFVPSGWWHQVENLTDALSVNHNWLNGANIHWSWKLLQRHRASIAREMPADDQEAVFQEVLEFRLGWNYESFHTLLSESVADQLRGGDAALQRALDHGSQGQDRQGAERWRSEIGLRLLGLQRLRDTLQAVQDSPAGREAALKPPPGGKRLDSLVSALQHALIQPCT